MISRNDWKMESLPNLSNVFEIWCKITTANSVFYAPTIYHPPDHTYNPDELVKRMYDSIAELNTLINWILILY